MRLQDYMIDVTQSAAEEAFRYAKSVPADKITWQPEGKGRSVLDICQELALCPKWAEDIIFGTEQHEWSEETAAAIRKEQEQFDTIDKCQAECNRRLENYFAKLRTMDDEKLKETKWLPYDGGRDFTMAEMMDYPHWNFTYHLGQIAYIQICYGDKEMH